MMTQDTYPPFEVTGSDPRIEVVAEALHQARRSHLEQMERHAFSRNRLIEMWPEYQLQIRTEAQAIIWALDKHSRNPEPPTLQGRSSNQ